MDALCDVLCVYLNTLHVLETSSTDYIFVFVFRDAKLIVLGSANVGKTCLLQRYLTGNFTETISVRAPMHINSLAYM